MEAVIFECFRLQEIHQTRVSQFFILRTATQMTHLLMKRTTHLCLLPRLRMCGSIPPLTLTPSRSNVLLIIPSNWVTNIVTRVCKTVHVMYEGCPESIQPFWISPEPVIWPWCNLAASQRRPYCASVNIHSPVGLVSRQWDAVDWTCVLCDSRIHKSPSFQQRFYLWEKPEVTGSQI